ncbi:MAG: ATP-binding protein [Desulfobacterales bacterium]|jgi:anti-sigma regulatory factor (Ser/Thr protein kinase)
MKTKEIRLSIESVLDNVPLISAAVNRLCLLVPFSDSDAHAIELCVTEAAVNSIKHGYQEQAGHLVEVIFRQERDRVVITISDSGTPMDPQILEEKRQSSPAWDLADIENIPESGRGLAIMQGFMDDVRYRVEGQVKHLILAKKFSNYKE